MKVKEVIEHLKTLDQDAEIYTADYYYEVRECFTVLTKEVLTSSLIRALDSNYNKHYAGDGNNYLLDFLYAP